MKKEGRQKQKTDKDRATTGITTTTKIMLFPQIRGFSMKSTKAAKILNKKKRKKNNIASSPKTCTNKLD